MSAKPALNLGDVARILFGIQLPPAQADRPIAEAVIDSRAALKGSLFVALTRRANRRPPLPQCGV